MSNREGGGIGVNDGRRPDEKDKEIRKKEFNKRRSRMPITFILSPFEQFDQTSNLPKTP